MTYGLNAGSSLQMTLVQGLYFGYQCYSLLQQQRRVYDFVDGDALMTAHLDSSADDAPRPPSLDYDVVIEAREGGRVMTREQVDEFLCRAVYVPYLRGVQGQHPGLIGQVMSAADAQRVMAEIDFLGDVDAGEGDSKLEAVSEDLNRSPSRRGHPKDPSSSSRARRRRGPFYPRSRPDNTAREEKEAAL